MFRTLLAAAAFLAASLPAHAQVRDELTSGAWTCWMTSLIGDPGMDTNLAFNSDGSLDGWFFGEVADGGDVITLEFSVVGSWTLSGSVITSTISSSELLAGSLNGEAFTAEDLAELSWASWASAGCANAQHRAAPLTVRVMDLTGPE